MTTLLFLICIMVKLLITKQQIQFHLDIGYILDLLKKLYKTR